MEERSLAHIESVEWIRPIKDADNIVLCGILGWQCVIKKGEFNVGDKIIYCEVDSVLPDKAEYEFLRPRKFRIRTIKLKGEVSQGLVLPLNTIQEGNYKIGQDVTELVGITKYLTPSESEELNDTVYKPKSKFSIFMGRYSWYRKLMFPRKNIKGFPSFVAKTDETRLQNIPRVLEEFGLKTVYITEKVDYQSVTFTGKMVPRFNTFIGKNTFLKYFKKYQFIVCSRNMLNNDKNGLYWKIANKYDIEDILKDNPNLTIQGEQGDTKIQGNKYGIKEPRLFVFNIIDHVNNYHYSWDEINEFCDNYCLETVPFLGKMVLKDIGIDVPTLVKYSKGKSVLNNKVDREGVVIRCIEDGKKLLSFKVINPDFLLKNEN